MINSLLDHWAILWCTLPDLLREVGISTEHLPLYRSIAKLLMPFACLHESMQFRTEPRVAYTLAKLFHFINCGLPSPESPISRGFKSAVFPTLATYVESQLKSEVILGICCLDPRFKDFQWCSTDLATSYLHQGRRWLEQQLYPNRLPPESPASLHQNGFQWAQFNPYHSPNRDEEESEEIERYFSTKFEIQDSLHLDQFSVLTWWSLHDTQFPLLSEVAQSWLALPVSSAASESAFSSCGNTMSDNRSSMGPETLSLLEFVGRNTKLPSKQTE